MCGFALNFKRFFIINIKLAFFVTPTMKPSLIVSFLKWIEYSRLRLSLGEKILESREILKNALILANPRQ